MKRIISILLMTALLAINASADEGMWMLPLLQKMNAKAMADLGLNLKPEQIYSEKGTSIKDAIVHFGGGCTGEIISDQGLLVTNHHCGYSSIQSLSSPEHNYLEDGYWAMNLSEELPAKGLTVTFLESMTDVTKFINKLEKKSEEEQTAAIQKLIEQATAENSNCTALIRSFYDENVYYLIVYKTYRDIRFVGAPPAASGKFGGDTDNWMWPRHTCDFSMFRVYAGPDNEPAEYSENNRPLTPKQSLKISLKGVKDGDYSMIIGYPGSTQRYMTATQLQNMLDLNDIRIDARTVRQDLMWEARMADPVVNLQYASKYAGSSNGWKKWQGEREAFAKLNVIGREKQKEADFMAWVSQNKKRTEKYGNAISEIDACVNASADAQKAYTLLTETIYRIELVAFSTARNAAVYKDYNLALDRKEASALMNHYLANVKPEDKIAIELNEAYLDDLFANSVFTSEEKMTAAMAEEGFDYHNDPAFKLYSAIRDKALAFQGEMKKSSAGLDKATKAYTAGQLEWKDGEPIYPDANSTMRLTYGTVKSYSPKDGVIYKHYTTLKGVMEKEDPDNYEFRVPAKIKALYEAKDFGQYANEDGELVTCFLTNSDITGGNSGSPVLNADGELIGLAFDGNWEAMSGDVLFEPNLQRCINVDIRYVLFIMDKFGGAGYLLDEMNLVK